MTAPAHLADAFSARYGYAPARFFFCPGRVNLIGEHIDYNGGHVFPAALTIGILAAVGPRADGLVRLASLQAGPDAEFVLGLPMPKDAALGWANYPRGVFAQMLERGQPVIGMDIVYEADLPDGAGLSSSAAIEVLTGYIAQRLAGAADADVDRAALALACQRVENTYIGVNSGIMDQFAVANGQAAKAIYLNCQTLEARQVPLELGKYALVVMNTNKERQLAESKYNERRAECDAALAILNRQHQYPDLCSAQMEAVDALITDEVLHRRARHVVSEEARVRQAVEVLQAGDLAALGRLLNQSHQSLRDDYEVTGLELDALAAAAQAQPACLGARMTGAGFGGCALAVVEKTALAAFEAAVAARYKADTGREATFYPSEAGAGVQEILIPS